MNKKILIVDDEEHILAVLSSYLGEQGFSVFEASTLSDASRQIKEGLHPDLILTDFMLKDGNSASLVGEIRQSPIMKSVPIIIMSAHRSRTTDKAAGSKFGADDFITKPFDLSDLRVRIEKLLHPSPND